MALFGVVLLGACAAPGRGRFPDRAPLLVEPEKAFSPAPAKRSHADLRTSSDEQFFWEWDRKLALDQRRPAANVNSLDEVPDSSFFTNRIAEVTPEQVRHGGEVGEPIDVEHRLEVVGAKVAGVTGGMVVKDSRGQRFVLKFDPLGRHGLLSGSEAATSRLLWAAGYNVPDNRVVHIDGHKLVPSEDDDAPSPETIAYVLSRAGHGPDGRIRALASRFVDGKVLGAMPWHGTRRGDPNDRVPHELRRELRGLKQIYVWVGNPDAKMGNSLDAWQEVEGTPGKGIVKHYLIDQGSSLGASGSGSSVAGWWHSYAWRRGNYHDGVDEFFVLPSRRDAARAERREREGVGYLYAGILPEVDPDKFEWIWYNPAFARADLRDAAWAGRILARFTEEHVRAAVDAAEWPPEAAEQVVRRMMARRASVLRHVFHHASPLDRPEVEGGKVCAADLSANGAKVCAAPRGEGYGITTLAPVRPGAHAMKVHLLAGEDEVRILGVER